MKINKHIFGFLNLFLLLNVCIVSGLSYFGFVPELVSNVNSIANFKTPCFDINMKFVDDNLSINLNKKKIFCSDTFVIANNHRMYLKTYFLNGNHNIKFNNISQNEINDIKYYGINIYLLKDGILESIGNLVYTTQLFFGESMEENNINFIKQKMNHQYIEWNKNVTLEENEINSGDLFAITRFDGLDPTIMWGTGSFIGHTAVALRINGNLYICESTDKNPLGESYWPPPYGIIKTPYKKWLDLARKADYIVSVLRLNKENQIIFNQNLEKVIDEFNYLEGMPYGYRNFLFGWIDTLSNNFPKPVSKELLINLFSNLEFINITKDEIGRFIDEAMQKRLEKVTGIKENKELSLAEIIEKTIEYKISIYDLLIIPEEDEWTYSDGKSLVCNTFVLSLYKTAGIFEKINNQVEMTEFTPKDIYELNIYDNDWKPKQCQNPEIFCQLFGKHKMVLPNVNSVDMYAHMNEKCDSMPPEYLRNKGC